MCYETLFIYLLGDIVGLFSGGKPIAGQQISGVVVHSSSVQVSVAFDDLSDSVDLPTYNGMIQLVKLANDVTYRRIKRYMYYTCMYSCYSICNCFPLSENCANMCIHVHSRPQIGLCLSNQLP